MTVFTLEITPHDEAGPMLEAVNADVTVLHRLISMDMNGNPVKKAEEVIIREWDTTTGQQVNEWEWARPYWGGPLRLIPKKPPIRVNVP